MRKQFRNWLNENRNNFENLAEAVQTILKGLLEERNVDFLSVSSRTKTLEGCLEKHKRKNYKNPQIEMTDIAGIRVIVYFENQIKHVSEIIETAFCVDPKNSLNLTEILENNKLGYRSVHYVCDLGHERANLPEFRNLKNLKFEIQVRTILQHAWAELAHDRNYKFPLDLPKDLERELFLLSGLLETADKGFDSLSTKMDEYILNVRKATKMGELDVDINSLSLEEYVRQWAQNNNANIEELPSLTGIEKLVDELNQFGISTLKELNDIASASNKITNSNTIFGYVRDWMIFSDVSKLINNKEIDWMIPYNELSYYRNKMDESEFKQLIESELVSPDFYILDEDLK